MNLEAELVIQNRTGLHARPAREFVNLAKRFQSDIRVRHGAKRANGKSLASLLTLGVQPGSTISIEVAGDDSEEALRTLSAAVAAGLGEEPVASAPARIAEAAPARAAETAPADPRRRRGIAAAPGLAIGPIHQLRPSRAQVSDAVGSPGEEHGRLDATLVAARAELAVLRAELAGRGAGAEAVIFDVHIELLEDPELAHAARARVDAGAGAARAWKDALEERAAAVASLADPLLAARAHDFTDVIERVLRLLAGGAEAPAALPDHPVIVVAPDLSPSQTTAFAPGRVLGICLAAGGATSHAAILARALGLPSVVGAGDEVLAWADGTPMVLDGDAGTALRDPDPDEAARAQAEKAARSEQAAADERAAAEPAVTRDGHRVEVAANVGSAEEARRAAAAGAEGVGLLRTEFLFLDRALPPSEQEQREVYAAVASALGGRPVIVRTLDVGGDKPLPYLPQPAEANPFLGVRGLRLCLARPALLREQLRAILGAAGAGRLRIMLPMVADLDELRAARAVLAEVVAEVSGPVLEIGIMIEVPSAAILAHAFAPEVDFFSIGSNDLTQYTLAMDRGHPTLAGQADGLHPAVLRLIEMTVQAAHAHGKWVGLCGELGADPVALPILVGLGLDELSVNVPAVAAVKARIRALSYEHARELAARALRCHTAGEVRRKAI
ncbi:MAG TPA: phosphoenolpyruvate--protein phosphotransferase [Kofleriaceae bacterium]|nr:phosphoenolpyruvate--protein phosphotransferase [Kofleriaceae bacterium]